MWLCLFETSALHADGTAFAFMLRTLTGWPCRYDVSYSDTSGMPQAQPCNTSVTEVQRCSASQPRTISKPMAAITPTINGKLDTGTLLAFDTLHQEVLFAQPHAPLSPDR